MEEFKEAFGTVFKTKGDEPGGEEEVKMEEILNITKAKLEKLPGVKKRHNWLGKKNVQMCYILL